MKAKKYLQYKKTIFLAVICLFIGAGVVPSISSDEPVSRGTIYVDDDADPGWYDATHVHTIQEGIDNASTGETVFVYNGTYFENLVIDKTVNLTGENRINTIIDGGGIGDVINITTDYVKVIGFTIQNSGSTYHSQYDRDAGIDINANHTIISNVIIIDNIYGIDVRKTAFNGGIHPQYNNFSNLLITNNMYGMNFWWSYYNYFNNITAIFNTQNGITFSNSVDHNTLTNINASNNGNYGIAFWRDKYNIFRNCTAKENGKKDIHFSADTGNNLYCSHIFDNVTGSGDKPIKFYNNNNVNVTNETFSECIICNADNSNFENITIEGSLNKKNNGFFVYLTDNSNFSKINSSNNLEGIFLDESSNNKIIDSTTNNNSNYGISILSYYLNYLLSSSNTIINSTTKNNFYGIYINSFNSTIKNCRIKENNFIGIRSGHSNNNTIYKNIIINNTKGIHLNASYNNTIYDNYFNNPVNSFDDGNNIWNISKTNRLNIIGGPYLGGNYWGDYTGIDTNGDGIGDTDLPYNCSGNIQNEGDWLPLVKPLPTIVYVDDNYDSSTHGWQYDHFDVIQDGIDAVAENGTVYVYNGTYYENIIINKTINLIGENKNSTDIHGNISEDVISVFSNFVNISEFTISQYDNKKQNLQLCKEHLLLSKNDKDYVYYDINGIKVFDSDNVSIFNNTIVTSYIGISIDFSDKINIINNSFDQTYFESIDLWESSKNRIYDNDLSSGMLCRLSYNNTILNNTINGRPLIYIEAETNSSVENDAGQIILINCSNISIQNQGLTSTISGIQLWNSHNCIVTNNNISNCWGGILMYYYCENNTIENNNFESNILGILLNTVCNNSINENNVNSNEDDGILLFYLSLNNTIQGNTLSNNTHSGINITLYSDNNLIYNNFFNNSCNAFDDSFNIWNISKIFSTNIIGGSYLGGNFWNDYIGEDTNNDGLGDTNLPYNSTGNILNGGDLSPLTAFMDINQTIFNRGFPIRHAIDGDWGAAQNFTPTLDTLTSVDIYLRKFGTPEFNLTVELREDGPEGTLLDMVVIAAANVPTSWTWVTVDIDDVNVGAGSDVFIVLPPAPGGVTTSFGYEWGYAFGNQYDDGAFWFTRDGGGLWRDLPTMYEFVFRTYGYN